MKNILFILLIALSTNCFGQIKSTIDDNGKINYSKIIDLDGTKSELYQKVLQYAGRFFVSANNQIQYKDENEGRVIAHQSESVTFYGKPGKIFYTVFFDTKDSKVRIQVKDITFENSTASFAAEDYPKMWAGKNKFYNTIENTSNEIINFFEREIKSNSNKSNDDW